MLAIEMAVSKAWQLSYDFQNPCTSTMDHICFDMDSLTDPTYCWIWATSSQASERRVKSITVLWKEDRLLFVIKLLAQYQRAVWTIWNLKTNSEKWCVWLIEDKDRFLHHMGCGNCFVIHDGVNSFSVRR